MENDKFLGQPYKKCNDLQFKYNANGDMLIVIKNITSQSTNVKYNTSDDIPKDTKDIISFQNYIKKEQISDLQINIESITSADIPIDIKNIITTFYSNVINLPTFSYPISNIMNMRKGENTTMNNEQIISYFKNILKNYDTELDMNDKVLSNMPIIKGTRIPVSLIVACLRDEMSIKEIEENYNINGEEIEKAMDFVIEILDFPFQNEE